jgi:hypothetical protein
VLLVWLSASLRSVTENMVTSQAKGIGQLFRMKFGDSRLLPQAFWSWRDSLCPLRVKS